MKTYKVSASAVSRFLSDKGFERSEKTTSSMVRGWTTWSNGFLVSKSIDKGRVWVDQNWNHHTPIEIRAKEAQRIAAYAAALRERWDVLDFEGRLFVSEKAAP